MTDIPVWTIRHVPSGLYLPEPAGRMGRGGSHVEPKDPSEERPRIFYSKLSAQRALTAWLMGKVHRSAGYDSFNNEYYDDLDLEPVPSRKREEMEIVGSAVVLP